MVQAGAGRPAACCTSRWETVLQRSVWRDRAGTRGTGDGVCVAEQRAQLCFGVAGARCSRRDVQDVVRVCAPQPMLVVLKYRKPSKACAAVMKFLRIN